MTDITNAQLAQQLTDLMTNWNSFVDNLRVWEAGTVTGGFNSDGSASDNVAPHGGYYVLSDNVGNTYYVPCPAKMTHDLAKGDPGADSGMSFRFNTGITDVDPGNGNILFNNATLSAVTQINADLLDSSGANITAYLDSLDDSTSANKGLIYLRQSGSSKFAVFALNSITTISGYRKLNVTFVTGSTLFDNGATVLLVFAATGSKGDTGAMPWATPVAWHNGTDYVAGAPASVITIGGSTYLCGVSHTSGTFATDLAANKWILIASVGQTGPAAWTPPAAWVTATQYVVGPPSSAVFINGSSYVCIVPHTAGTFATDLGNGKWQAIALKGADGAGVGNVNSTGTIIAGRIAVYADTSGNLLQGGPAFGVANAGDVPLRSDSDARYQALGGAMHEAISATLPNFRLKNTAGSTDQKYITLSEDTAGQFILAFVNDALAGQTNVLTIQRGAGTAPGVWDFYGVTFNMHGDLNVSGVLKQNGHIVWDQTSLVKATAAQINAGTGGNIFVGADTLLASNAFQYLTGITGAQTPNLANGSNLCFSLTGNMTLNVPTGMYDGQQGVAYFIQPAGGNCTLALNAAIKKPGGVAPTLSTGANAVDRCGYVVRTVAATLVLELTQFELGIG